MLEGRNLLRPKTRRLAVVRNCSDGALAVVWNCSDGAPPSCGMAV